MKKIIFLLKNKYFLFFMVMFIWLMFFDRNNMIERVKTEMELNRLKKDKEYYLQQIDETNKMKEELFSNQNTLEKFAREKYLMKKDNEDIFLIEE
jgi:cell division protein FtsB